MPTKKRALPTRQEVIDAEVLKYERIARGYGVEAAIRELAEKSVETDIELGRLTVSDVRRTT